MSYEEQKAQAQTWAFTISDCTNERKHVKTDYQQFWKRCEQYGLHIEEKCQEIGGINKVPHYHGIIVIPKGFYRKKLMITGISMKLVELFDKRGWIMYINKTNNIVPLPQPEDELIEDVPPLNSPKIVIKRRLV